MNNQLDFNDHDDLFDSSYEDEECDAESLASLENEEDFVPKAEKILAEHWLANENGKDRSFYYLIKWENCPRIRSSWESKSSLIENNYENLLEAWEQEKLQREREQKAPFDIKAWFEAVDEAEKLERGRRNLRRWKRQLKGVLAAVTALEVDQAVTHSP